MCDSRNPDPRKEHGRRGQWPFHLLARARTAVVVGDGEEGRAYRALIELTVRQQHTLGGADLLAFVLPLSA